MPPARVQALPAQRDLPLLVVLALLYFLGGRLGLATPVTESVATLIWPPTGLAIAAILTFGLRIWPGIFAGALAVNVSMGLPVPAAIAIAIGNTLEAVLAWRLLAHGEPLGNPLASVRRALQFLGAAVMLAPMVSAGIGTLTLAVLAGSVTDSARTWLMWWLGDLMGALLLAPILMLLLQRWLWRGAADRISRWGRTGRDAEWLLMFVGALAVSGYIYAGSLPQPLGARLGFVPYLFVLWTALRLSPLATVSVSLAVSAGAIAGTLGNGQAGTDMVQEVIYLYAFLFIQTTAALLVAAVVQERRQALAEAEAARELALHASQQKSRFLANMSHEIRTPLNGIIGMATLLKDDLVDRAQQEKLRIIQSSADSLLNVLNDIIDHARIEAGKLSISPRRFAIAPLVRDVAGLFQGQAELKGIELRARIDGNLPAEIHADDSRLRQVLVNVVSNAVKFTEHGSVLLQASRDYSEPDLVCFTVTDTGIGIAPDALAHVFEPFVQVDGSSTRRHGGSGLGLTISKQLVENMGGRMTIQSTPGAGTTVVIRVPAG